VQKPTQAEAQSTAAAEGTGLGQTPSLNATVESSGFTPTPANNTASFAPQPALQLTPTQQEAQVQVTSGQQAQVQSISSQTSYDGESEANKVSGAQKGQDIEQVFESSKSSDK
jgi:hypothetical protein